MRIMGVHLVLLGVLLVALGARADDADELQRNVSSAVDEVQVTAPEPRYVAPTLRDRIGRVWAPVYINGKGPFRLVLDTGANRSAITLPVAMQIGAPILASTTRLVGVTGSAMVPTIHVDSLQVGDLWLERRQLAIVDDVFGGAQGVLGADGLSDKRIIIDFTKDHISIQYSRGTVRPRGFARVPVRLSHGHLLLFNVNIAGVRTTAMLDTGAQVTIGNDSLRRALEKRFRRGSTNSIMGVTLDEQEGEAFRAPPVDIGSLTIHGMPITFGEFHVFDAWDMTDRPALLIGMDVIGVLEALIIDYKHKELHLRTRR